MREGEQTESMLVGVPSGTNAATQSFKNELRYQEDGFELRQTQNDSMQEEPRLTRTTHLSSKEPSR